MQDYSKLLIERGWRTRTAPDILPTTPIVKNSKRDSSEGVRLDGRAYSDVRDRMEASARQFEQPHAYLFPLIGKRVATPRGPGRLITVFEQRCEVVLDVGTERITCFRPEEVGLAV
jgi:hypothetical protein